MDVESGANSVESGATIEGKDVQMPSKPVEPKNDASSADWKRYKSDMLKYKDQVEDLTEKLQGYELREQEAKGDLQKVIQRLKQENSELKQKYSTDRYNYAFSKIEDSIKMEAAKMGCKDPETFFRLIDQAEIKAIEVDDSFNARKEEIKEIVSSNVKKYEHLGFFDKRVNVIDKAPSGSINQSTNASKDLSEMSKDELLAYAKKHGHKTLK